MLAILSWNSYSTLLLLLPHLPTIATDLTVIKMHPEKRQSDGLLDFGSEAIISLIPVSKAIALAAICLAGGLALVSLIIVITRLWARMRWAKTNGADWSILFANVREIDRFIIGQTNCLHRCCSPGKQCLS